MIENEIDHITKKLDLLHVKLGKIMIAAEIVLSTLNDQINQSDEIDKEATSTES